MKSKFISNNYFKDKPIRRFIMRLLPLRLTPKWLGNFVAMGVLPPKIERFMEKLQWKCFDYKCCRLGISHDSLLKKIESDNPNDFFTKEIQFRNRYNSE